MAEIRSALRIFPHILKLLQRHADDLVHVVIAVGRQAADEGNAGASAIFGSATIRL